MNFVQVLFELQLENELFSNYTDSDFIKLKFSIKQKNNPKIEGNEITTMLKNINNQYFIFLKLDNYLDPSVYDTNFYIDENITHENITINNGIFVLDNTIGEFGGYKIPVNYIK